MKRFASALLLAACSEPTPIATIELALVPEDVTSIVVWVTDSESGEIVASATVAPSITSVDLGVPAERQLEFSILARTAQPGPAKLGGLMPGWVGRALKKIPLGREQVILPITAYPAGALTLTPVLERPTRIKLTPENGDPPLELELVPDVERVLALRTGRYRATVADEDEDRAMIAAGDGLFVARRIESIGIVQVEPRAMVLPPEAVRRVELMLTDAMGNRIDPPIETSTAGVTFRVLLEAFAASGMRAESDAEVTIEIETSPASLIRNRRFTATSLPARSPVLEVVGTGRVSISASAVLTDADDHERTLHDELRTNARTDRSSRPPARLDLELLGPREDLIRGTRLSAELIDDQGFFSEKADGTIDFAGSDPWLFFPQGPAAEVTSADGGHLIREVARPSGPRGLFVVLRAVFTSTAIPGTLTASVTLPVLESTK